MNIAIFGGTFNPFHIGHFEMLKTVCEMQSIDKVLVIPDFIPPHKKTDYLASDNDRLNMCILMCNMFSKAEVSTVELDRKGKSYTYVTLTELKEIYKNDDFFFVLGGDMVSILDKWYKWEELIKTTNFIAFSRNDNKEFLKDVKKMRKLGANITVIDKVIPDVSSTDFRNSSNKNLLPKEIYEYIIQKGLYNA